MSEKPTTIVFFERDVAAAKARTVKIRSEGGHTLLAQSTLFRGNVEFCNAVVIMPDVTEHDRSRIEKAYGDKVIKPAPKPAEPAPTKAKLTLPPPPVRGNK